MLKSGTNTKTLLALSGGNDGIGSSELAAQFSRPSNALAKRLLFFEHRGMIVRTRIGKNSITCLAPKGAKVANTLRARVQTENIPIPSAAKVKLGHLFRNVFGELEVPGEIPAFWRTAGLPQSEAVR